MSVLDGPMGPRDAIRNFGFLVGSIYVCGESKRVVGESYSISEGGSEWDIFASFGLLGHPNDRKL